MYPKDLEPQGNMGLSWASHEMVAQHAELEQECAALRQENEHLTEQILELKRLLSKISARQSTADSQRIAGGAFDNRTAAAEMLANVDVEEFELLWRILEDDELDIKSLQSLSDLSKVVRVVSWLSNCHAVVLSSDTVTRTEFGRQLFGWLMNFTEAPVEGETGASR